MGDPPEQCLNECQACTLSNKCAGHLGTTRCGPTHLPRGCAPGWRSGFQTDLHGAHYWAAWAGPGLVQLTHTAPGRTGSGHCLWRVLDRAAHLALRLDCLEEVLMVQTHKHRVWTRQPGQQLLAFLSWAHLQEPMQGSTPQGAEGQHQAPCPGYCKAAALQSPFPKDMSSATTQMRPERGQRAELTPEKALSTKCASLGWESLTAL